MALGSHKEVLTTPYTLAQSGTDCRFHELNSRARMELGIAVDASQDMQAVYFKGSELTALDKDWIIRFNEEGSFWIVTLPVGHTTKPKAYWRAYLEILRGLPTALRTYYD